MCEKCSRHTDNSQGADPQRGRRQKLWEITGGMHCSIIGTCLSHEDLLLLAKRCRLNVPSALASYEVHSFFVTKAGEDGPIARALHKLLDQKFEGIVRKVSRCACDDDLAALWEAEFAAGRVSGAYWAFMSQAQLPGDLKLRIFGEVHMLSHVLGRTTHQTAVRATDYAARAAELEDKLNRERQRHVEAIAERDRTIAELRKALANAESSLRSDGFLAPSPTVSSPPSRAQRSALHRERALKIARERARSAESDVARLTDQLKRVELLLSAPRMAPPCPAADACNAAVEADRQRVLYLGGRRSTIDQLRSIAERANAELWHHDGGIEQAFNRIDGLVEGCDVVFCPIDCISHSACQRAKALCRKHNKTFVPLRSSGVTTFARALETLTLGMAPVAR